MGDTQAQLAKSRFVTIGYQQEPCLHVKLHPEGTRVQKEDDLQVEGGILQEEGRQDVEDLLEDEGAHREGTAEIDGMIGAEALPEDVPHLRGIVEIEEATEIEIETVARSAMKRSERKSLNVVK